MKHKLNSHLGQTSEYKDQYDNTLLVSIARSIVRESIGLSGNMPFKGADIWNCYEISWLTPKGRPCVRIMQFSVPAESECIIESKSLKLYLNSFNATKFDNEKLVIATIEKDLSATAKAPISLKLYKLNDRSLHSLTNFQGINIDDLDIEISDYNVNTKLLKSVERSEEVAETICSNLLKSNCLVTSQPDWASLQITYKGQKIDHESLLKYIISFRNHDEFHEQCVEHIFNDIMKQCAPTELTVYAKYTRRGGIDINPFRTNLDINDVAIDKSRDVRQ